MSLGPHSESAQSILPSASLSTPSPQISPIPHPTIAVWVQAPVAETQASVVHGSWSSHFDAPLAQVPLAQTSPLVQTSPSLHAAVLFTNPQPLVGSHESVVQGLLSSHTTATWVQFGWLAPVSNVHLLPSSHATEFPLHTPAKQTSPTVLALPSLQLVPEVGRLMQPPACLSHESAVQELPSSQFIAPVPLQVPPVSHWSLGVHAFPSSHATPLVGENTQPVVGSHVSLVQELLSLQTGATPPTQLPLEHLSPTVHASPSVQMPEVSVWTQPLALSHVSFVHPF